LSEAPTPVLTLRDRKKAKLRRVIMETAHRLFLSRGYDRTTLEQVCEEAETSLRTLLRYFPTKEELALGREIVNLESFKEELARLKPSTPVLGFWRERIRARTREIDREEFLAFLQFLDTAPAVTAKVLALQVEYENLLADAFAREAGVDPAEDLYGRLLAGMLVSGNRAASRKWLASGGRLDLSRLRTEVIDWAAANFPARSDERPAKAGRPTRAVSA